MGWGNPAIGGVSIRQDASPRQGRPGGQCMSPAVTFSKMLTFSKFCKFAFFNSRASGIGPFGASDARILSLRHRKLIIFDKFPNFGDHHESLSGVKLLRFPSNGCETWCKFTAIPFTKFPEKVTPIELAKPENFSFL